jgi:hypothetical protein
MGSPFSIFSTRVTPKRGSGITSLEIELILSTPNIVKKRCFGMALVDLTPTSMVSLFTWLVCALISKDFRTLAMAFEMLQLCLSRIGLF